MEESRIYVAVAGTVQVPAGRPRRTVEQPAGRQIAQACHVVSKLRHDMTAKRTPIDIGANLSILPDALAPLSPITTIILQARDSAELRHVQNLLLKKKLNVVPFFDMNIEAYGAGETVMTAVAVYATKKQVENILDYLPLWGAS